MQSSSYFPSAREPDRKKRRIDRRGKLAIVPEETLGIAENFLHQPDMDDFLHKYGIYKKPPHLTRSHIEKIVPTMAYELMTAIILICKSGHSFLNDEIAKEIIDEVNTKFKVEGKDQKWMNHQLYQLLCLNLEDKALKMVKNIGKQSDVNGIIGWCKLMLDVSSTTKEGIQGMSEKVYKPKRVQKYVDINSAIEDWETNAELFAKTEGKVTENTRIFAIRQIVPEQLEQDILKSTTLKTYEGIRSYITEQIASKRDVKNTSKGPVSLDLSVEQYLAAMMTGEGTGEWEEKDENPENECFPCESVTKEQLMSFVKGQMGKGGKGGKGKDGGGKGKFDGLCHHCGIYGHRINQCWKKDKEMEKGKSKGKGDPFAMFGGKNGYGGGYNNKGKGKGDGGYNGYGGKGGGKGGKGGGMYGFDGNWYEGSQEQQGDAWTLASMVMAPPGLKPVKTQNRWKDIEEKGEDSEKEEKEQKAKDLKEMEWCAKEDGDYENKFPKTPMGNYSKKTGIRPRFRPIKAKELVPLSLFFKDDDGKADLPELCPATIAESGWQWVKGVVDSGAANSVAHPDMCPQYPVRPSAGSKAGVEYTSASGGVIPNLGEQTLEIVTQDGREA